MCSIGEDDFGDEGGMHAMLPSSVESQAVTTAGDCTKCSQPAEELYKLNFRQPECRACFLNYARHKFRAALGASKALPRGAEVLLLIDGTPESLVLLDMLHYAQTQNTFKRLHCNVRVLYIDAGSSLSKRDPLPALRDCQRRYTPFEFHVVHSNATPDSVQLLDNYIAIAEPKQLEKHRNLTAHQDYAQQQRKRLMGAVAAQLRCSHIFESSICSTLATQLLSSIALGRGGSVALDVALFDDRLPAQVKLLRPLKDLNAQEVQLYVKAQQLQAFPTINELDKDSASLQNLTKSFVDNLQLNYASTVSTIFRTGDKIAAKRCLNVEVDAKCALCQSDLEEETSDTLLAIEYSRSVSEAGAALQQRQSIEQLEKCARERLLSSRDLCHACSNIKTELGIALT
ncbi:cytoplasmic tRNA 2-thiolation protein 2 [Drosophila busckii]|uniref:cytoplasmic tRNA 2-thiolation protein 2 n=1 Tax=Drosophila busckii TaxID=30019 RepID=UPI001432D0A8|nr:cytoplasmic tRNA 2-thiolation protein 2 [Drosophila busckii]